MAYAKKFFGYDADLTKKIQASEARSESPLNRKPIDNSISQNPENASGKSDAKYSLSDTEGRTLTKEQQEYFKDSKGKAQIAVALNDKSKMVYHSTKGLSLPHSHKFSSSHRQPATRLLPRQFPFHLCSSDNFHPAAPNIDFRNYPQR